MPRTFTPSRSPMGFTRCLAASLLLLLVSAASAGLPADVRRIVQRTDLGGATVAVSVREPGPGLELVDIKAERPLIPASNMKLITTGAALHALGADFRFQTRIIRDGSRLIVVGDGDPAFGDPELLAQMTTAEGIPLDVESFLQLLVQPIIDSGMKRIEELVIDDRIFDREYVHQTWPQDQLNRRYCAQVAGFNFHLNVLHFFPEPRPGQRPSITYFEPRVTWSHMSNQATSRTGSNDENTAWIARRIGGNELTFYGNVKHAYQIAVPVTIHDMPSVFGQILAERLEAAGVKVEEVRVARPEEPDPEGEVVGPIIYTPIQTAISRCNQESQNLYAECLLKRIGNELTGQPGSWMNGGPIIRHVVHERLEDAELSRTVLVADGSGLSRNNRISPAALTAWLNSFHNDELLGEMFIASLAVAGEDGTLRKRMRSVDIDGGVVVQAKSGYINGVSALSGYVTAADGHRRCFSIIINDLRAPVYRAKQLQDEIVAAIAADLVREPVQLGSD